MREAGGGETDSEKEWERRSRRRKLAALLKLLSRWEQGREKESERMRDRERQRAETRKNGKFFRDLSCFIYFLFVVNILDQICSLFGWFLVCLEDNNIWFTKFFFFVKRMCQIFVIHLIFFFLAPTPSYFLKFWASLPLGGLRQLPDSPKGRAGPDVASDIRAYFDNLCSTVIMQAFSLLISSSPTVHMGTSPPLIILVSFSLLPPPPQWTMEEI